MIRKVVALLACSLLLTVSAPPVSAEASTATIAGMILNPSGKPAFGFKVVLRDVASNAQFMSEPTDAAGNYSVDVPLGGRYKIEGVVADDGVTHLPVIEVPPVNALTAGTTRLNVQFTTGSAATAAGADPNTTPAHVPWYKTGGGITGIVIGSAVIVGLAVGAGGGGDSSPVASASLPGQ